MLRRASQITSGRCRYQLAVDRAVATGQPSSPAGLGTELVSRLHSALRVTSSAFVLHRVWARG